MQLERWLRGSIYTGIFAVPFIPFLVSASMFFPFITGKNFAFRILVEILVGLYVLLALRYPAYRPRCSWIAAAIALFVGWAVLATFLSVDPGKSFWSNFERMEGLLGLLHLGAYFVVLGGMMTKTLWVRLFQTSVGASVLMGVYGFFQLFNVFGITQSTQSGLRLDATFGNATYFAVYMLIHLFLAGYLAVRSWSLWYARVLYFLVGMLQVAVIAYSGTRGAALGVLVGVSITLLLIAVFERERKSLRAWSIGLIGLVAAAGLGFVLVRDMPSIAGDEVLGRFAQVSLDETTIKARFLVWDMALAGFAEKPFFGWGQENFNFVFNKYYNPAMYNQEQWFDRAHNSFLDWLIAGGLVSFISYAALFVLFAVAVARVNGFGVAERAVLIGLVVAYAIHLLFVFDNLISSLLFFTLLAFAHTLSKNPLPLSPSFSRPLPERATVPVFVGVFVVVSFLVYFLNIEGMGRARLLLSAITPVEAVVSPDGTLANTAKDPQKNLAEFRALLEADTSLLGRQEGTEQVLQFASAVANNQSISPQTKDQFLSFAYETGKTLLEERPGDARLELFFGAFLNQFRRYEEALVHLERARALSPRKQSILFEIGVNSYLNAGEYEKALPVLKEAFDLAPEFRDARVLYAIGLIYNGRYAEADALLTERFGTSIVDDNRLLRVYFDTKRYDRVIAIWEMRIEKNPSDIQNRVSLAATHLVAGDRAKAIAVLRDAIAINPAFRETGERFIKEIQEGKTP